MERKTREKRKRKKRVEEISQDEKEKIREEERRKILKELRKEKHASYSSHNSCKSLSEELNDYYEGRHMSHLRPHTHRRENERKPQEANINPLQPIHILTHNINNLITHTMIHQHPNL